MQKRFSQLLQVHSIYLVAVAFYKIHILLGKLFSELYLKGKLNSPASFSCWVPGFQAAPQCTALSSRLTELFVEILGCHPTYLVRLVWKLMRFPKEAHLFWCVWIHACQNVVLSYCYSTSAEKMMAFKPRWPGNQKKRGNRT